MLLFELVQCITLPLPLQRLALAVSTIAGPLQVFTLASSQGLSSPGQQADNLLPLWRGEGIPLGRAPHILPAGLYAPAP